MSIMGKGYEYTNADRAGDYLCVGDFGAALSAAYVGKTAVTRFAKRAARSLAV